jgi:F-box-like
LCVAPRDDHLPVSCCRVDYLTIDVLPDEVLLEIFDFYVCEVDREEEWETLVHVCRRWRYVVFGSPHRLDLRLICTVETPTRDMLDIWPASLPIVIRMFYLHSAMEDTLIAAFEQVDRVCEISVEVASTDALQILEEIMADPLPSLKHLQLLSCSSEDLVIPDSLLGGSAPRLESLYLKNLALPKLPKLLLSATGLMYLSLLDIPPSGYISPEAMVECLYSMTRLEELEIRFEYFPPRPRQVNRRPPPITRTVLSVLTTLIFEGAHEYFNHVFGHIDAPLLESVQIKFFHAAIFDIQQIPPFIYRIETFEAFKHAHMLYRSALLLISLSSRAGDTSNKTLLLSLQCRHSVWQLQSMTYSHQLPLTNFDLQEQPRPSWGDGMPDSKWIELLRFFPALETMCISSDLAPYFARALEELGGGQVTEVLPALQYLFISGLVPPIQEAFGKFVTARQLSGHPVVVQRWPGENIVPHMRWEAID